MKLLSFNFNYFRNIFITNLDLILFILVVGFFIYDIILIVSFFINKFTILNMDTDVMHMSTNAGSNTSYNTNVGIDRNSGSMS
jgi:hypothetical protein